MVAPIQIIQRRRILFKFLLVGLLTQSTKAAEPTPIDSVAGRMNLQRRTDANSAKDIEAAREYIRRLQAGNSTSNSEPRNAPKQDDAPNSSNNLRDNRYSKDDNRSQDNRSAQIEMPEYQRSEASSSSSAGTNDSATTRPAIGSPNPPSTETSPSVTVYESAIPLDCGAVVYEQIDMCSPSMMNTQPTHSNYQATKPILVQSTIKEDEWSEEQLVKKIERISGGALVLSELPENSRSYSRTSGYRSYNSTNPVVTSPEVLPRHTHSSIRELEPPTYSAMVASTSNPSTRGDATAYKPVSTTAFYTDTDAMALPTLPTNSAADSAVQTAAFQFSAPPPNFNSTDPATQQPMLNAPPGMSMPLNNPGSSGSVFPPGTSRTVTPGVPSVPAPITNPSAINPNTTYGNSVPYDMPNYQRTAPIVTGEPFVTEGPCQFDAAYMVTPAYGVMQASASQCGPYAPPYQMAPSSAGVVPGYYAPPTVMPNQAPGLYTSNAAGLRPLFGFGQENYNVQIGRGIIGQPVAYVPGQSVRNFLRYLFP